MKEKEKVEVCDETMAIGIDTDEKTIIVENIEMKNVQIEGARIAICDYCNAEIGKYSELKKEDLISPEKFTRAVKNGLMPPESYMDMFKRMGVEKKEIDTIVDYWKTLTIQSQTPWALCDKCKVIINKFADMKYSDNIVGIVGVADR